MTSNLFLKQSPLLQDYQKYIQDMVKERGFQDESAPEILMLLVEEVGELAKSIRKTTSVKNDVNSENHDIEHEIADVFSYILALSNFFKIDLEKAFRDKEEINKERVWK